MCKNNLANKRKEKGFTQADLAKKSGISRVRISEIENTPSINIQRDTMEKLAKALGEDCKAIFF